MESLLLFAIETAPDVWDWFATWYLSYGDCLRAAAQLELTGITNVSVCQMEV